MKISGTNTLQSSTDQVWAAINDPAVLARCIPGCESLTTTAPDQYAMRVTAGVAAIKGTYEGEVSIFDKEEPSALRLRAIGAGAPGTIDATVAVRLSPANGGAGTELVYDADAVVGGTIGGVGQRMLAGVTRKMAGEFFTALDQDIVTGGPAAAAPIAVPAAAPPAGEPAPAPAPAAGVGTVYPGRAAAAAGAAGPLEGATGFAVGTLVGGLLVGIGVLIGSRIGRRR
ncbi:MAG: carbon monoxide dehydrogenase subunit G [Actinomycetales bacterium]|nr:carbon monoxide dehydrogenase subunit G [Actinomycetales bacterium]